MICIDKKNTCIVEANPEEPVFHVVSKPDIYGQTHVEETPQLIARKLKEFKAEIAELSEEQTKALRRAQEECPSLLTTNFQLLFLRCDAFNAKLAAKRYAKYWTKRLAVFGPEKAFLPMTLDGALKDDTVALGMGIVELVPGAKDPKGRSILYSDPSRQVFGKCSRESMIRALWYTLHAALENRGAQKYGVIFLINPHKVSLANVDAEMTKANLSAIQGTIPIRVSAIHLCRPPAIARVILPLILMFMNDRLKKRLIAHVGSTEKVGEKLRLYGLDSDVVPTQLGGDVKLNLSDWLAQRKRNSQ